MNNAKKIPVTILTGFLGSGKTTLLNRILSEEHGSRIAVIENEYGEVSIDQGLVINADEEIFEMSNGCICCTVRGDLIRILGNLVKRRDKFDYVLVETTGLADPGPVAQTFFMDDEVAAHFSLDGIITLVDAFHIQQQLGRSDESTEQIAFADVILLNKTDLVKAEELDVLEARLRDINRMAQVHRCEKANVDLSTVLNLSAFDLDQMLVRRPNFLEPEYPFEWTGIYELPEGRYELSLDDGPDSTMSLVVFEGLKTDEESLRRCAELNVRHYAEPAAQVLPGGNISLGCHIELQLQQPGQKSFFIELEQATSLALFAQHTAEEFGMRLLAADGVKIVSKPTSMRGFNRLSSSAKKFPLLLRGSIVSAILERVWVAQHEHDDEIGSVVIELDGDVKGEELNLWLSDLLRQRGADIFRMKGFISVAGESERFVFQGVHMLFDGQPDRAWGNEKRRNQLVFIGRNLDSAAMKRGFEACLS